MKTTLLHMIFRLLWLPSLGAILWLEAHAKSGLNWLCAHPSLWTEEFGYMPVFLIAVGFVIYKKWKA